MHMHIIIVLLRLIVVKILPENDKDFIYLVLPVRFKNEG